MKESLGLLAVGVAAAVVAQDAVPAVVIVLASLEFDAAVAAVVVVTSQVSVAQKGTRHARVDAPLLINDAAILVVALRSDVSPLINLKVITTSEALTKRKRLPGSDSPATQNWCVRLTKSYSDDRLITAMVATTSAHLMSVET